ncbi:MAG TPA: ABC transporter permease [Chloroflexus aurantiacus]|jgi:spermidine/putrescine transport system permease protein|uniref:Binding-protein-dependent transport systems inner membrane component n=1 Tax=Chloroflexus aurantiacus (strain ATCC 29366 / DSM 635 / J-10-fl) TaxID=324602 RepID=A9WBU3_CHLAA|nr:MULTISPECIES: ABC transporter permease [Chloroflexus]ABY34900.1 binding-protein-dependent transport systems inner membrane component [Chloroflexus aurantiacus J-10-fl]RMG46900.1 MAG: ABC transporter permease [Chloroflexota bacterium]GIV92752.1 MAG: ABC transporter permease [Chloroflexus sp.]HBW69034.1 ABC transporter permease [Chloroflexus aurantiacus]
MTMLQQQQQRRDRVRLLLLLSPGLLWLLLFFALPLVIILVYSFMTNDALGRVVYQPTLDNYITIFTQSLYVNAYWRSIWTSVLTTVICLLIGYPLALFIARSPQQWRMPLLMLILIPFWTNFLVRIYAWQIILANNGIINGFLEIIGVGRLPLLNNEGATLLGLVYGELPFMVLPLYAALDRFDFTLMEAAADLGANKVQAFLRVMLPMTMPGIVAGSVLVFIPTLGQFVVSELLGGAKVDYLGNLIQRLFLRANPINWPLGSAMAVLMMIVLLVLIMMYFRATTEEER